MATELGHIASLLECAESPRTPLQQRLTVFGRQIAIVALAICAIIFAFGLLRGEPLLLMLLTALSLAVAAIPEALPAVVTVLLALGAGAHGARARADPPPAGGGDAGLGHHDLFGQDRHADP